LEESAPNIPSLGKQVGTARRAVRGGRSATALPKKKAARFQVEEKSGGC